MGVSDLINNTNTLGNAGNLSNLGQANINILGGNMILKEIKKTNKSIIIINK